MNQYIVRKEQVSPFPHYWEMCVGSCHAATALREDYRRQLRQAHEELGFRYVRFHGLFDDDMSVVLADSPSPYIPSDRVKYSFMNTDNVFDFLLSIGMKPFLELGFMPRLLASGTETVMAYGGNITVPKDFGMWGDLIEAFARHLLERYGEEEVRTWFFEVWNEPNLPVFWNGTMEDYFLLYETTARAVKKVCSDFLVGGPATSINAWIPEFRNYCKEKSVPLDFISTHHYPTDDPMWNNPGTDLMALMAEQGADVMNRYDRHIMRKMTERACKEAGDLPLYYTEWNVSAVLGDAVHDEAYTSAYIARITDENDGLVKGYSWWTFSDIFEEMGQIPGEFHGGFGLMTYHGIPKPAYRCYELLHRLGEKRVEVAAQQENDHLGIIATEAAGELRILLYNHNTKALNEISKEEIVIQLPEGTAESAKVYRIDEQHGNAHSKWETMGSPMYLTKEQTRELLKASELAQEKAEVQNAELRLTLPPYGVALIVIEQ